jgi:hypothetical protein
MLRYFRRFSMRRYHMLGSLLRLGMRSCHMRAVSRSFMRLVRLPLTSKMVSYWYVPLGKQAA